MHDSFSDDGGNNYKDRLTGGPKDTALQLTISVVTGLVAFFAFCILRPRWPSLYAARKRQKDEAESLPELPKSLFGWIPVLWSITEEQVLASAGLDAFVFLVFFKMAIKFLSLALFFAFVVIKPVHDKFAPSDDEKHKKPHNGSTALDFRSESSLVNLFKEKGKPAIDDEPDYLWMYLVFAYFFTALVLYLVIAESKRIIQIRQDYLGSQSTITDRTIRLSGIPEDLQEETKIKDFIEELEIGSVDSVLLVRDWSSLDTVVDERDAVLRKLERALVENEQHLREERSFERLPTTNAGAESEREDSHLLDASDEHDDGRPLARIWFGKFSMNFKFVDAIDYHQEKLRRLDEKIEDLRSQEFPARPLAFVTMDSVASCQMAVQAVLDSSPLQLIATPSPSPSDITWSNTYLPPRQQLAQSWTITVIITLLTLFWSIILLPIAGLIDLNTIHKIFPQFAEFLESHPFGKSLVQTQLPTLVLSLLNVLVPYLYSWLSYQQGIVSQGDVELSVISKNFFFTFFNFFIVFTALGTASLSFENFGDESLRETANKLAQSISDLRQFYVNYIILQALALFPLRLLEFGSVSLYPFGMLMAKTPRERAELVQPPTFSYGFFLPQTILIFLICIVYSVLKSSWHVLLPGLAYFVIGFFVYKYQLLYAMDHQQHSTGRGWVIIVDRIIVGLVIFQVTMAGQLALRLAFKRSVLIVPLIIVTLWFSIIYDRNYTPLMTYIALKSIKKAEHGESPNGGSSSARNDRGYRRRSMNFATVDEERERGMRFINPNLTKPLETPWVNGRRPGYGLSRSASENSGGI